MDIVRTETHSQATNMPLSRYIQVLERAEAFLHETKEQWKDHLRMVKKSAETMLDESVYQTTSISDALDIIRKKYMFAQWRWGMLESRNIRFDSPLSKLVREHQFIGCPPDIRALCVRSALWALERKIEYLFMELSTYEQEVAVDLEVMEMDCRALLERTSEIVHRNSENRRLALAHAKEAWERHNSGTPSSIEDMQVEFDRDLRHGETEESFMDAEVTQLMVGIAELGMKI